MVVEGVGFISEVSRATHLESTLLERRSAFIMLWCTWGGTGVSSVSYVFLLFFIKRERGMSSFY